MKPEHIQFMAWIVGFILVVTLFAGDKFATGLVTLILLSMMLLNADKMSQFLDGLFPKL
jgi:predicted PurR-regulated permease PerM